MASFVSLFFSHKAEVCIWRSDLTLHFHILYIHLEVTMFAEATKVKHQAQQHSIACKPPAARKSPFPVHYPNQQSMLQPVIYDWCKVQSFPRFIVSAACKMPFLVLLKWKGAHKTSEWRASVPGLKFSIQMRSSHIFQIHLLFGSKNTIGFHLVIVKSGFSILVLSCVTHGTRGGKKTNTSFILCH